MLLFGLVYVGAGLVVALVLGLAVRLFLWAAFGGVPWA
jgi:hypothetical protein